MKQAWVISKMINFTEPDKEGFMSILGGIQNGQASVDNIRAAAKRIRILINFNCCQQKKKKMKNHPFWIKNPIFVI